MSAMSPSWMLQTKTNKLIYMCLLLLNQITASYAKDARTIWSGEPSRANETPRAVIVRPQILNSSQEGNPYPSSIYLSFVVQGAPVVLHLHQRGDLLSNGLYNRHQGTFPPECYYSGSVNNSVVQTAAVSLCRGLTGVVTVQQQEYILSPTNGNVSGSPYFRTDFIEAPHNLQLNRDLSGVSSICSTGSNRQFPHLRHHRHHRQKRSIQNIDPIIHYDEQSYSHKNVIEVMIAVSSDLKDRIGEKDLEDYLLTHMIVTSTALRHPTIGASLSLKLSRIVILDKATEKKLNLMSPNKDAYTTYLKFCQWQNKKFVKEANWDLAILLIDTRFHYVNTMAITNIGEMCSKRGSCLVAIDWGLTSGFIIAHEIGHLLGAHHDEQCANYSKSDLTSIMSTHYRAINEWFWSPCTRYHVNKFLRSKRSKCLRETEPGLSLHKRVSEFHPGERYDLTAQCKVLVGSKAVACHPIDGNSCVRLYCRETHNAVCSGFEIQWAYGTPCGLGRWCQNRFCVRRSAYRSVPIDGQWSDWSGWNECSQSCNGGIQYSSRNCTNPSPRNGGNFCIGFRKRFRSCNTRPCPGKTFESRESQCRRNGKQLGFDTSLVAAHIPTLTDKGERDLNENPCLLECEFGRNRTRWTGEWVRDGTPCFRYESICRSSYELYTDHICVHGRCKPIGCDRIVGSSKRIDRCGVCGGDNSTCEHIEGVFNKSLKHFGVTETVLTLPKGASNIKVEQGTYMYNQPPGQGAKMSYDEFYMFFSVLNGPNCYTQERKVLQFAGSVMKNSGIASIMESIFFQGPLMEAIEIRIVRTSKNVKRTPNVQYSYYIPAPAEWSFVHSQWSECTRNCQGVTVKEAQCVHQDSQEIMEETLCHRLPRPDPSQKSCNEHCIFRWHRKLLTPCSARCGKGLQKYQFVCQMLDNDGTREVDRKHCDSGKIQRQDNGPLEGTRTCYGLCIEVSWSYTNWSPCSKSCGTGTAYRRAFCKDNSGNTWEDVECKGRPLQKLTKSCSVSFCPLWKVGSWSTCDALCGDGFRSRIVRCYQDGKEVEESECRSTEKPNAKQTCRSKCKWDIGEWSTCSVSCGQGVQKRSIQCVDNNGKSIAMHYCTKTSSIPRYIERCEEKPCLTYSWEAYPSSECRGKCGIGKRKQMVYCYADHIQPVDDSFCQKSLKPPTSIQCDTGVFCNDWTVGKWGQCSRTCGEGYQIRSVVCEQKPYWPWASCDDSKKPTSRRECNLALCPFWKTGKWSDCDSECGPGQQHRRVRCVKMNGERTADSNCDSKTRPKYEKFCNGNNCYTWTMSEWNSCSVTCGRGQQTRSVMCISLMTGLEVSSKLCKLPQPQRSKPCHRSICPSWKVGEWSECVGSCGFEIQKRKVNCHRPGETNPLPDHSCPLKSQPVSQRRCQSNSFCIETYEWRVSKWNECSKTCGKGSIQRNVTCVESGTGVAVNLKFCEHVPGRPADFKSCFLRPCPIAWRTSVWSECSKSCGPGVQTRMVECRAVTPEGWLLEIVNNSFCGLGIRPVSKRECNLGDCNQKFLWYYDRWKPCSRQCKKGLYTTRKVKCIDRYGKSYPFKNCGKTRPPTKRFCGHKDCYASSCRQLRDFTNIKADGEYRLMIQRKMVKIYCYGMATRNPQEFINLKRGPAYNFANTSALIALYPKWCPEQNRQIMENCSMCTYQTHYRTGITSFYKIRLQLRQMTVKLNDFTFSNTEGNSSQFYGTAGDCFGRGFCPQGRFHIDLRGTDFRVSKKTKWETEGRDAAQIIIRGSDNKTISGRCGGYCGQCRPVRYKLYLNIDDS